VALLYIIVGAVHLGWFVLDLCTYLFFESLGSIGEIIFYMSSSLDWYDLYSLWQAIFFTELYASETWKLVERLVNYVIYKANILNLEQMDEVDIYLFRVARLC